MNICTLLLSLYNFENGTNRGNKNNKNDLKTLHSLKRLFNFVQWAEVDLVYLVGKQHADNVEMEMAAMVDDLASYTTRHVGDDLEKLVDNVSIAYNVHNQSRYRNYIFETNNIHQLLRRHIVIAYCGFGDKKHQPFDDPYLPLYQVLIWWTCHLIQTHKESNHFGILSTLFFSRSLSSCFSLCQYIIDTMPFMYIIYTVLLKIILYRRSVRMIFCKIRREFRDFQLSSRTIIWDVKYGVSANSIVSQYKNNNSQQNDKRANKQKNWKHKHSEIFRVIICCFKHVAHFQKLNTKFSSIWEFVSRITFRSNCFLLATN
ncbi:hypothetical protein BDA99DRAFT_540806 [Phascolomyces articulosus]|uniref:Uncharacterized protein n=1 Tax=Phascolomyces articulosus TaxID=60185 RepID=A0AAD5PAM3_9FUNG|nr:hypothetical protein BDA99DRAFT_540806 [Phascolomyces articulosus]